MQLLLREKPQSFLGALASSGLTIEQECNAAGGELLGPASDLLPLRFGHSVGHDAERWHTGIVQADDIVKAFDDDEAVFGNEFAVARFGQPRRLLAEEF